MARVCYLGAPSHVWLPANVMPKEKLRCTGENTGNLLIGHALRRHLKAETFAYGMPLPLGSKTRLEIEYVNDNFDYVVIGASNFVNNYSDLSYMVGFLEKIKLPCVIIGLGAQSPSYDEKIEIPASTERMLKIVSEHSVSLGVRGYFSASVLNDLGIKNVRVIGCPSMYWTCQPHLKIEKKQFNRELWVSVNGSANVVEHSFDPEAAKWVEQMISNLSFTQGYPYVLQNERPLIEILEGNNADSDPKLLYALRVMYGLLEVPDKAFIEFVKSKMMVFFNIEGWMNEIKKYDFVIGSRFHGNLIALLVGIPSFIFVHDSRTQEMCELFNIPHIDVRSVKNIEVVSFYRTLDYKKFEDTYVSGYQNYIDFLEENNLEHNLVR